MMMTKEIWMQNHFQEHFHDKVNKQALLELTLGINTLVKPENPLAHAFQELMPCHRVAIAPINPVNSQQKFSATSRVSDMGVFAKENQEKPSQPQDTYTPTKKS